MLTVVDKLNQIQLNQQVEEDEEPIDSLDMYEDDFDEEEVSDLENFIEQDSEE